MLRISRKAERLLVCCILTVTLAFVSSSISSAGDYDQQDYGSITPIKIGALVGHLVPIAYSRTIC